MEKIFFLRMDFLFPVLFWGNVISLLFLAIYHCKNKHPKERRILAYLITARLCHAFYYFVASGRGILPDWLSVSFGNSMLLVGFFCEARAILRIIKENTKAADRLLGCITVVSLVLFNAVEFVLPYGGIRITMASGGVVAIMALPNFRMLFSRDSSAFTRFTALFYSVFLVLLLLRAWFGLHNLNTSILTTNVLHSLTFLALLLQLMIALPAYTLILKDYADEALRLMATTDRLTGATNRHAFQDAAVAIYNNCKYLRLPISVLFIDIDYFKQVNDTYGHAFGDTVLARLARIIDTCLRESDLSCRYGGEEFVVLLPRADCSSARLVAQRIIHEVRGARFEERPDFAFTISIGVSCGVPPCEEQNVEAVIREADEAMYLAKRTGRDRIVFYGADISEVS